MSDEKQRADEAAENILLPENRKVEFLSYSLDMKPVPVSVAKELRRLPVRLSKLMEEAQNGKVTEKYMEMDEAAADLYVDVVQRLLKFYKIEVTRESILELAPLAELKHFIEKQSKIQGEEDFLFKPFLNTMEIFSPKAGKMMEQNS